jgi:hypothetical protein
MQVHGGRATTLDAARTRTIINLDVQEPAQSGIVLDHAGDHNFEEALDLGFNSEWLS